MSLHDRIHDARHWLHRARKRFFEARRHRAEVRDRLYLINRRLGLKAGNFRPNAEVDQIDHPHEGGPQGDVFEALKDERGRLIGLEKKLTFDVQHRREVKKTSKRKLKHLLKLQEEQQQEEPPSGLATFDGKTVAAHFIPWLIKIRARGVWSGYVVSGYRTPAYSQSLCYGMCGAPTCPGTCAGIYSSHSQYVNPYGAIDVSDYYTFASEARAVGAPFFNDLPYDRVHFSYNGH